jgi:NitT/TauT family transport system substrate-binding protein
MTRLLALTAVALALLSCAKPDDEKLQIALNWKPEPEFGGIFEAERLGAFTKRELAVERTGGPGAPVVQMVTSGQVAYGVAAADEVVIARARGADVVAIFATYQVNPQGSWCTRARIVSLDAPLQPRYACVEPGLPYEAPGEALRLRRAEGGSTVQHRALPPGSSFTQQVFVTAEPSCARTVRTEGIPGRRIGYTRTPRSSSRMATRCATRGAHSRLRRGLREGWQSYLVTRRSALMGPLNPRWTEAFRPRPRPRRR